MGLTSTSYSWHQPDNQEDDANNEQNPEERACYKAYNQTQHPQNQDDKTNYQEYSEHINLLSFLLIFPSFTSLYFL